MKKESHCIGCKTVLLNDTCPNCSAKHGPLRGCVITFATDSLDAPIADEAKERADLRALIRKCREEDEAKALESARSVVAQPKAPKKEALVEQVRIETKPQYRDEKEVKSKAKKVVEATSAPKPFGRPRKQLDLAKAQALLDVGKPWAAVAAQLSVSVPTLRKALADGKKVPQARPEAPMERKARR